MPRSSLPPTTSAKIWRDSSSDPRTCGYRIIVVDDDSPDGTGAHRRRACDEYPGRLSVIHRTAARGLGRALVVGLKRALEDGADLIFQMDADFSHDPKYMPAMAAAAADSDFVLGSRYLHGVSVVNWPLHRIILSSLANSTFAPSPDSNRRLHDRISLLAP